jgi:glutamine cyclotransferase
VVTPTILRTFPHDTAAFTQGLLMHDGRLYESTGEYGQSQVRVLDTATGAVVSSVPIDKRYFGEGLALSGDRLVQLTWREGVALTWRLSDLSIAGSMRYAGEGWGLSHDGAHFVMSNGSDTLVFRDEEFRIVRRLPVRCNGTALPNLNELECANGRIYANVWYNDCIYEIDPASGNVMRIIDCSSVVKQAGELASGNVLNGIARGAESGVFFLTGKNWGKMFVVRIGG